jgi:hypothetical protein
MNEALISTIGRNFEAMPTADLLAIWNEEKRDQYSDETFEAVRRILSQRGHAFSPKVTSSEIDRIEKTHSSAPRGNDWVCTECHAAFTQQRPPGRSFLGFARFVCPQCGKLVTYPLTRNYKLFYWLFLLAMFILCVLLFMFQHEKFYAPGPAWVAALIALGTDGGIKRKVRHAWYEHDRKGQPRTVQPPLPKPEQTASLDPIRWFHVVFAIAMPYVAFPWGIVNLIRGRKRSGVLLLVAAIAVLAVYAIVLTIILLATRNK